MKKICFITEFFKIHENEEKLTNPGIYGQECANWLKTKLEEKGYKITDIFPEDWGWCLIIHRKPFFLCIACNGEKYNNQVIWSCYISVQKPFFKIFLSNEKIKEKVKTLQHDLLEIIEKNFKIINCP